ncbi:MAG: FtsX-like permease family protein [Chloroflexota bacterium]
MQQISAILRVTLKRLRTQPGITLASICGLTVAVVLMEIVPLYADAVNFRILEEQLATLDENRRPPWSYIYTYVGNWHGDVEWETIQPANNYLRTEAPANLGLPLDFVVQHVETPAYRLFPTNQQNYSGDDDLGFASFATTTDIESHIELVAGSLPTIPTNANEPIEVLISQPFAVERGWQVGEQYFMRNLGRNVEGPDFVMQIAGIWQARDASEPFWFYVPGAFDELFLVPEETFATILAPVLGDEVNFALWYLVMDGSGVGTAQINRLVAGASRVEQQVDVLLPEATAFITPTKNLNFYRQAVAELSLLLFSINVPTIWMTLAFIGLVAGLAVNQQRNESAVIRSRGGTPMQVTGMAVAEGVLLGLIAFVLGTIAALWLTQLLAQARSFLDFTGTAVIRMNLTSQALGAGLLAILLAVIARVIPAIAAAQHTIITYKQEQARAASAPWWRRAGLDLILLAIAGYGFYILRQQGSLLVSDEGPNANAFQNPLLLLLPALTIFAFTLLFLRFLPWFMQLLARLIARSENVSLLHAVRYLARTPRYYTTPLGLLILTIGLAVFTASLARTVDLQLYDQSFYKIGADISLITRPPSAVGFGPQANADELLFTFLPVTAYERLTGIKYATRVGSYEVRGQVDGSRVSGQFIGIDPAKFHKVGFWRDDFSRYRFGTLMNALGFHANGVLVPNSLLDSSTLRVGDAIRYTLTLGGGDVEFEGIVVGSFDYFPTWYPAEEELLIVGNLTNVFEVAGGEFPYQVWAEGDGQPIETDSFRQELLDQQLFGTFWDEARPLVATAQGQPQRQGLFGLLSVGFITSALLTVLGFFLYALYSLQRRTVELGILRAVGLDRSEMIWLVAWELVLLIICGLLFGTGLGVLISQQFIPFLQVGSEAVDLAPPYLVEIAWEAVAQIYILFGLLFVVALAALSWRLLRIKLFESIKLGETA